MRKMSETKESWHMRPGFTLIELLVVISIIALLLSILMPALSRVKEQARTLVCKTRLKDIGLALSLYANDNSDKLPPSWASERELSSGKEHGDLRWFVRIEPYYGVGRDGVYSFDLFRCPEEQRRYKRYRDPEGAAGIYGFNWFFTRPDDSKWSWRRLGSIRMPSSLPLLGCMSTADPLNLGNEGRIGWRMFYSNPHPSAYEYGWMDGDSRSRRHEYSGPAPNHRGKCNFVMADFHVEDRDVCKEEAWPWFGNNPTEQQSGKSFHPTRHPDQKP